MQDDCTLQLSGDAADAKWGIQNNSSVSSPNVGEFYSIGGPVCSSGIKTGGGSVAFEGNGITIIPTPLAGRKNGDPVTIVAEDSCSGGAFGQDLTSAELAYAAGYTTASESGTVLAGFKSGTWSGFIDSGSESFVATIGEPFRISFSVSSTGAYSTDREMPFASVDVSFWYQVTVAPLPDIDLVAGSIDWAPPEANGTIAFEYSVAGEDLAAVTSIDFYWATGDAP